MKSLINIMLVFFFVFLLIFTERVLAVGETFKIETTGTEYCGNNDYANFTARNNIDLWAYVKSDNELIVSFYPDFPSGYSFSMYGDSYSAGKNRASFVGGVLFDDFSYATMQGIAKLEKNGTIKSLEGIFIQSSVIREGCFSSGKFKTSQRIQ
jgi:hypothetical protein